MRAQRASSNVFSMLQQTQIQEFKEVFTLIDQDRDGFIDKEDLKDTYESPGKLNVKNNELEDMLKEACSAINFTMFLNLFGEKLHGTDPEEIILNTFRMFNPNTKGYVKQMFQSSTFDPAGNLDYKSLCYIITRGEEQEE
ncbi:LOW QUALITY PROTEIN: myosin light chain 5-like [Oncorhynchus kisutch]|uniref:LOW QUALITY PROTEIN: myosin light chain 5-like n=1 Tax=Oncorhynchus kisutch TaxID=8019 RepID=UPI00099F99D7|nr:LOW QUALITY PROTEIN: myosin light chain 5-like [Oncorhynchus kisutch]